MQRKKDFQMCLLSFWKQRGNEVNSDFWKDMLAAIDHNYNTSAFKGMDFLPYLHTLHSIPLTHDF